jgi:hypothetical protein
LVSDAQDDPSGSAWLYGDSDFSRIAMLYCVVNQIHHHAFERPGVTSDHAVTAFNDREVGPVVTKRVNERAYAHWLV